MTAVSITAGTSPTGSPATARTVPEALAILGPSRRTGSCSPASMTYW